MRISTNLQFKSSSTFLQCVYKILCWLLACTFRFQESSSSCSDSGTTTQLVQQFQSLNISVVPLMQDTTKAQLWQCKPQINHISWLSATYHASNTRNLSQVAVLCYILLCLHKELHTGRFVMDYFGLHHKQVHNCRVNKIWHNCQKAISVQIQQKRQKLDTTN
jgi:hypothetical protein